MVELHEGARATVDLDGIRKNIDTSLVDDVAVGDYVVVHVGFALGRVDPEEAARTLDMFGQLAAAQENAA